MLLTLFYLSSGLFLGWSLGANDAANIFGTAVGTRIIKFRRAAVLCSIFVVLGAVFSGAGASHSLGALGSMNNLSHSFTAALAAALSAAMMTRAGLPVSTSQAVVGSIIGWNFFQGQATDMAVLQKFALTWVLCPLLSALFALTLYFIVKGKLKYFPRPILTQDRNNRWVLIVAGSLGAYALGANNIANVMGVFVPSLSPEPLQLGWLHFSGAQQLFFIGALAISLGVFTYSKKTMMTVGSRIYHLSPTAASIAVISHSLVLFLFSSQGLRDLLLQWHLPTLPLVPVSSSQAIVGAVFGIGLAKGGKNLKWALLGKIFLGWLITPVIAATLCYLMLFFVQNVFVGNF
jgi:PiT family inorganic phosphate transporter